MRVCADHTIVAMPKFKESILLSKFSHYKIGGPARFFFEAKSEKDVRWAVKEARKRKLPVFVLGGGTNLLISDDGFDGLVLRVNIGSVEIKGTRVTVGAGVMMADLLKTVAARSLAGLEWAGGLPGTVGGAIRGNAGCFGGEIKDAVASVRSFDMKTGKIVIRSARQCGFRYRHSIFKKKNGTEIILSATLALKKGNKKEIAHVIKRGSSIGCGTIRWSIRTSGASSRTFRCARCTKKEARSTRRRSATRRSRSAVRGSLSRQTRSRSSRRGS